jgi:hypothetical protein
MPTVSVELMKVASFLSVVVLFRQRSLAALALSSSYLGMLKAGPMVMSGLPIEGIKGWGKMTFWIRDPSPCLNWIAQHSCMIRAMA